MSFSGRNNAAFASPACHVLPLGNRCRSIRSIIFFGELRKGKPLPDNYARIGYCAAKKLAFLGFRLHLGMAVDEGIALGFETTPANFTYGKTFPKLWGDLDLAGFLEWIDQTYGDNADYTPENIALVTRSRQTAMFSFES